MNSYSVAKEPIFFNEDEKRLLSRIVSSRVTFNDVCGMDDAKRYLETPLLYNETRNHKEGKGFLLLGVSTTTDFHSALSKARSYGWARAVYPTLRIKKKRFFFNFSIQKYLFLRSVYGKLSSYGPGLI